MGGILALFQLLKELVDGVKWLAQFIQDNKNEKWFQDSAQLFSELRKAQTPEEKKDAAKKLRDLLASLGG